MGTWEEESSELLESQNEISKDVILDGACRDGDEVDVKVEVVNDNDDNVDGDHKNNVVVREGDLVQQFERVKLEKNGSDGYAVDEEASEERGEYDGDDGKNQVYPLRPYAEDCSFYIKTGSCKFGQDCKFNHPSERAVQPAGDKEKGFEGSIGSVGDAWKIKCKYFQSPGGCKFGDACRYNHSSGSSRKFENDYLELNFLGLPIRPSAKECTYYLQKGSCGYGANCRFNHPNPSASKEFEAGDSLSIGSSVRVGMSVPGNYAGIQLQPFGGLSPGTSGLPNGMNIGNAPRYAPQMSAYRQAISLTPGWNQNQVMTFSPANKYPLPHQIVNNSPKRVNSLAHYENPMQNQDFPERPGQRDCDYFMRTGTCNYRSACRYNHPKSRVSNLPLPPLFSRGLCPTPAAMRPAQTSQLHKSNSNNMRYNGIPAANYQNQLMQNGEFPERAGLPECDYYMKTGQCKYKSACRYNHPRNQVPTSSQCAFSIKGLPLRPGAKLCRNYEQEGKCKYGRNCLYDHPDDYSTDVPVSAHFHKSPNVPTPAYLEPPVATNVSSAWEDDGWRM